MFVICGSGGRSAMACTYLMRNDFNNAISVNGGMGKVKELNMSLVITKECPLSKKWNSKYKLL